MLSQSPNRMLAGLPPSDYAVLAPALHAVTFSAGARSLPVGQTYFPHDGVMSLLASTPDGQTIEMASAGRDGLIGPLAPSDAVLLAALGTVRVSQISTARLQAAAAQSEALAGALAACHEALIVQVQQNLVCCGLHPLERRLSRWLLDTADRLGSATIPVTQEIVAQRLGVRRTSVTLLAGKLQATGAILWGRSRVEIVDRARLEPEACSCRRPLHQSPSVQRPREPSEPAHRNLETWT